MQERRDGGGDLALDLLKGAVAGAAAVWVMDRVDWFMYDHEDAATRARTQRVRPEGLDPAHLLAKRAADALGIDMPSPQAHPAGLATHYAIGIAPAALYAALRRRVPAVTAGRGTLFGLALDVVEDEVMNPALGLAAPPGAYPWQDHARGLVAHLVYGAVVEATLRALDGPPVPRGDTS